LEHLTGAAGEFRPVVALFCTRGMEEFLSNALCGILRTGISADHILIGCPANALGSVTDVSKLHPPGIRVISTAEPSDGAEIETYQDFGAEAFLSVAWRKVFFIRQLIDLHACVIYADLDIAWLRNPLPYLAEIARAYPMAFQTEALPRFPPAICAGFALFTRSERSRAFLDTAIDMRADQLRRGENLADQDDFQYLIDHDPAWLRDIFFLPEALFLNGLGYRQMQNSGDAPCRMEGELQPFLFHANWTIGLENKRKLLAVTAAWRPDERADLVTEERAPEPPDAGRALLTVIFPNFEQRGELLERIKSWTEQDLNADRYRIVVATGAETEFDEVAVRTALRDHDSVVRTAGEGNDADYWNAGAHEATTPWLLFVESHTRPDRDSLSSLAAWIDANPIGAACNFRINNLEGGKIDSLMKRWFAEIHEGWTATPGWSRLHRTAFAMRRDVFNRAGRLKPEYGQFAPALLSAELDRRGIAISLLPESRVGHFLSQEMTKHHEDTADYVRGELAARAATDPGFFEGYFGPPPLQAPDMMQPGDTLRLLGGLLLAAALQPRKASRLLPLIGVLLPAAFAGLRTRARMLTALTRADEWLVMQLSGDKGWRWRRFVGAQRRVVRTEVMNWIARNPPADLQPAAHRTPLPPAALGSYAVAGLHALERWGTQAWFRWSQPLLLLRLAPHDEEILTVETRNVRGSIHRSEIVVIVNGKVLSPEQYSFDNEGNLKLRLSTTALLPASAVVAIIAPELREPPSQAGPGRRLGLPVFSVGFDRDTSHL
jgi:Nucleotide-diphospho-sugar transferase/Glycosyl transferase family 2